MSINIRQTMQSEMSFNISQSVSIGDCGVWISKQNGGKKEAGVELLLKFQSSHN